MGQALYRTHRPKKLSEVVGQEHIARTLEQALKQGRISHAYLFTGPRGIGKTSVARILAHEINDLPYEDSKAHLDIIEIDAASNRRIDEIRELRDKVYVAPTSAKYKVYIIDEVHMLTREAFNALLKTLEEPPEHAVFILATTDAHKLPETIVSRTQRFTFKPIDKPTVVAHLRNIAKQENITISDEALELLAEHGEGSFRDSISLLDQASSHGQALELQDVLSMLGMPSLESIQQVAELALQDSDSAELMKTLEDLSGQGYQASAIAKQLGQKLRNELAHGSSAIDPGKTLDLLDQLLKVPASHDPERLLEIVLLKAQSEAKPTTKPPREPRTEPDEDKEKMDELPPSQQSEPKQAETSPTPDTIIEGKPRKAQSQPPAPAKATPHTPGSATLNEAGWQRVLAQLKQQYNTLYSVIRIAKPVFSEHELELIFAFPFHQKRVQESENQRLLLKTIKEVTGQDMTLVCRVEKQSTGPQPKKAPSAPAPNLKTISNIFGGGELLES